VQYGAADAGVAGKDVLLEHGGEGLYQPLDLGIRPLPHGGGDAQRLRLAGHRATRRAYSGCDQVRQDRSPSTSR
jgi:ATP phosphoribosyltransferase